MVCGEGRSASVPLSQINHPLLLEVKPVIADLPYLCVTKSVPVWDGHYEYIVLCCGKTMKLGKPRRFFQEFLFTPLWMNLIGYPLPFHKLGLDLLQDCHLCLKTSLHLPTGTYTSNFQCRTAGIELQAGLMFSALQP